jgi:hypothetical protein
MRRVWWGVIFVATASFASGWPAAEEPADGEAIVTDADGKAHKLAGVRFGSGTKRLTWLADPQGTSEDANKGPVAMEFREPHSTTLVKGVITLVPVGTIESLVFDHAKQEVTLSVKGLQQHLVGILGYQKVNVLGITGMSDGQNVSFVGGTSGKSAVKTMSFGGAHAPPKAKILSTWNVQIAQPKANDPVVIVHNLKVLTAHSGGVEKLADAIPVRKGEPIPFDGKLKRFEVVAHDQITDVVAAEVEVGGAERTIVIPHILDQAGKPGTVVGFLGEVDAGWKLFPLHTIKVITPSKRKIE